MSKHVVATGLVLALATPAWSGTCATRAAVVERLQTKYAEELAIGGLQTTTADGTIMEVWASPQTGTFTVLVTQANGITCIVAAGTDFFSATSATPKPKGTAS